MASTSALPEGGKVTAREVLYCAVCSFPPEYCEFSSKSSKCKQWLQEEHPDLFSKFYSEDALEDKLANLTVEQKAALEKDLAKKEKKEEAKAEKEKARIAASKVVIKRIERTKRKHVTTVSGLEAFDIDLKKASKFFATKFAASSSVTKTAQGGEEITIQGDIADEIEEMILDEDDKKAFALFGGKIGEDQVEVEEVKLKKKPTNGPLPPPQFA